MDFILSLLMMFVPQHDADALRATAPSYLTPDTARAHLAAARFAATTYGVDADLLLAIAWHESRYIVSVVGPPVRGKRACGVMQPLMWSGTCPSQTVLGGYLEGARHVRAWLRAYRGDPKRAMLGYAGGWDLVTLCTSHEATSSPPAVCRRVEARHHRAAWIRRLRASYAGS